MSERYELTPVLERVGPTMTEAARALARKNGRSFRTWHRRLYRWKHAGLMASHADYVAVLIGEHPENLWPGFVACPHCGKAL